MNLDRTSNNVSVVSDPMLPMLKTTGKLRVPVEGMAKAQEVARNSTVVAVEVVFVQFAGAAVVPEKAVGVHVPVHVPLKRNLTR